jgi:hypothetical protein
VTKIGRSAFSGCASLANVAVPESVKEICWDAFSECESLTYIAIPKGVQEINSHLLANCVNLENVEIPQRMTKICNGAFWGCVKLESIKIPSSVREIERYAFRGCNKIKISVSPRNKYFRAIGNNLYTADGKKLVAYLPKEEEYSFVIPEGVTEIGSWALGECKSLESITIPSSVKEIAGYAFENCSALKDVYYCGSKLDWEKIKIGKYGNEKLNGSIFQRAKIHYNCK